MMLTAVPKQIENEDELQPVSAPADDKRFPEPMLPLLNRELSLLQFHRRVLEEALDQNNPLLERLKFFSIFASNTDEFFMIRVSGLKEEVDDDVVDLSPDGMTAAQQLTEIRQALLPEIEVQMNCLNRELLPQLKAEGIEVASYDSLNTIERHLLDAYFAERVFPVLTPLAVDRSHPFPYISPLSLNLGLMVETPVDEDTERDQGQAVRFVRIKVPSIVDRLVPVRGAHLKFVLLEDLIVANIKSLFPGTLPGSAHAFRVTRDADVELRDNEADDLLRSVQQGLRKRRFGAPVRLEVSPAMPDEMVHYLTDSLGLAAEDVYRVDGPLKAADLMPLYEVDRADLKDTPFETTIPEALKTGRSIFDVITEQDLLLHHPFNSYKCVTDFVDAAVSDPDVLAIKICLYRTGPDSPIPPALIRASEQGKQVTALIELKARFDEAHNIEWAKRLDEAGVHVVYGMAGLKTHGKLTLVVRREGEVLKRYAHIASGNYNPTTSCTYTDLSLFTANEEIGADASEFFNYLTGCSNQTSYRQLIVAPVNLRERVTAFIEREIAHQKAGRPARIVVKMNRLADTDVIQKLYEASQAGVRIDLIVRGICMLRPGVPGLSETISVRNVVGRLLEHSRIFYFANGGDEEVYIGSADWMHRNLSSRVEVLAPVSDVKLKSYLKDDLLAAYLRDNTKARTLLPNGKYERPARASSDQEFDAQKYFMDSAQQEDTDHAPTV
jgi:polyphosphate kinase